MRFSGIVSETPAAYLSRLHQTPFNNLHLVINIRFRGAFTTTSPE
jgi:hypothetical protein